MHVEKHVVSFIYQAISWGKRRRFCVENVLSRVLTSLLQISFGISGISTRKKIVGETSEFCTCTTTNRAPNFFLHQQERNVCKVDWWEKYHTTLTLKVTMTQQQVSGAVITLQNDLLKKPTFKEDVLKKKTLASFFQCAFDRLYPLRRWQELLLRDWWFIFSSAEQKPNTPIIKISATKPLDTYLNIRVFLGFGGSLRLKALEQRLLLLLAIRRRIFWHLGMGEW